jgi:hypothetical protein
MSVVTFAVVAMLGLGWVPRARATPWRDVVAHRTIDEWERVDLAGLATIELPPGFKPVGRGQSGPRLGHFDPATLGQHRNEYQITFRFEQGQHTVLGSLANPVLLHVTLFNPGKPKPDATRISFTTIAQFYPPRENDRARLDAHFAAQRWLPDVAAGDAISRAAATDEGSGDNVSGGSRERWLVIHVDPARRIRVDLYAWRTMYSVDEARTLARRIAESVQTTPKLAELFDGVNDADARAEAKLEAVVASTLAALSQCGIRSMGPGMVAWSDRCASWLSEDRRFLRVARTVGRVPIPVARERSPGAAQFRITIPAGRSPALSGLPDFRLAQLVWDDAAKRWSIAGFGDHLQDDDTLDAPLISAILPRLHDHSRVHLLALASYDLRSRPDRVTIAEFIAESTRVADALREGKVITGVRAMPDAFEQ